MLVGVITYTPFSLSTSYDRNKHSTAHKGGAYDGSFAARFAVTMMSRVREACFLRPPLTVLTMTTAAKHNGLPPISRLLSRCMSRSDGNAS
ncbi:hypothetical protein BAUCODRAFT_37193, partial [Baudoinia panamericana UAMH 10762]